TAPPAPLSTQSADTPAAVSVPGAFHIHTRRSDGALDKAQVAEAAARAGLRFAIFTDHGNGTQAPDPPAYVHGVLCLDGVEISTNGGHYIALGIPAAPYPLGGEAEAVAEDVRRLGGFGVAAHPFSPREELAWRDWSVPVDGIEWLNADSEWRDEGHVRLSRAFVDYLWRPAGALASLLDRSADGMRRWDDVAATRRIVALPGHDAHGGFVAEGGEARGRRLHIPSYEAVFKTFSLHLRLPQPLGSDAARDGAMLLDAIERGHAFTAIEGLAAPASLSFSARTSNGVTAHAGDELPASLGRARFTVRSAVPARAVTVLLRNGRAVSEHAGGSLDYEAALPGAYRVEVHLPNAPGTPPIPWLVSNPIYRFSRAAQASTPAPVSAEDLSPIATRWRIEASPGSQGTIGLDGETVTLTYAMAAGATPSPFVALATDVQLAKADAQAISVRGRADRPMRVSVQLRFNGVGSARWGRSVYLDSTERAILLDPKTFRSASRSGGMPPLGGATSLLFVVDLVNAVPGAKGRFAIDGISLVRQ
ncbi:MAG: hypothetical protein ACRD1U_04670, partial [Vicinamibacterales bacterium]